MAHALGSGAAPVFAPAKVSARLPRALLLALPPVRARLRVLTRGLVLASAAAASASLALTAASSAAAEALIIAQAAATSLEACCRAFTQCKRFTNVEGTKTERRVARASCTRRAAARRVPAVSPPPFLRPCVGSAREPAVALGIFVRGFRVSERWIAAMQRSSRDGVST